MQAPTYVIAMEVLDNLPHDKLVRPGDARSSWQQVAVSVAESDGEPAYAEVPQPLADPLIRRCLAAADWLAPAEASNRPEPSGSFFSRAIDALAGVSTGAAAAAEAATVYVPTGALQLFDAAHTARPRHHLIAADFSSFAAQDVLLPGRLAPIVSVTVRCHFVLSFLCCLFPCVLCCGAAPAQQVQC